MYGDGSSVTFQDCAFTDNAATASGGGLHWDDGAVTLIDCTFTGNTATNGGGGLHVDYSDAVVTDCDFEGNGAGYGGGPAFEMGASLTCSLVYENEGGDWTGCIAGQEATVGNWHVDPRFCGLLSGDYTLCSNSDCLPDNNPCVVLLGAQGEGCGECNSAVEPASWGVIKARWR